MGSPKRARRRDPESIAENNGGAFLEVLGGALVVVGSKRSGRAFRPCDLGCQLAGRGSGKETQLSPADLSGEKIHIEEVHETYLLLCAVAVIIYLHCRHFV